MQNLESSARGAKLRCMERNKASAWSSYEVKGQNAGCGPPHLRCRTGGGGRLCAPSLNNERRTTLMFRCGDDIHDPDTGEGRCGKHSCCSCVGLDELESELPVDNYSLLTSEI